MLMFCLYWTFHSLSFDTRKQTFMLYTHTLICWDQRHLLFPSLTITPITQEFYWESSLIFVINGHVEFLMMRRNRIFYSRADFGGFSWQRKPYRCIVIFLVSDQLSPTPALPLPPSGQNCENSGKTLQCFLYL